MKRLILGLLIAATALPFLPTGADAQVVYQRRNWQSRTACNRGGCGGSTGQSYGNGWGRVARWRLPAGSRQWQRYATQTYRRTYQEQLTTPLPPSQPYRQYRR